ncbi:MAG TPA: pseudaminic acid cytidylyltransferase [Bacillota bacterium]|nr:pseudaminic acid cytidylyltransferase [Bacillota bacterium]
MSGNVAIITARGGSKRIPGKNIKEFCGKPILQYSIQAAIDSGIFDEIMVSTDDAEIAEMTIACGAKVPFMRSSKNSDDFATTADVIGEVLAEYKKTDREFQYACCIYPTAPFVTGKKLQDAMRELIASDADSVIPVVGFSYPPQRGFVIENGRLKMKWPEHLNSRSQDLETIYHDCGQFYCFKISSFQQTGKLVMDNTIPFQIPELQVQDIDTEEDWKLAELKYRMLNNL